MAELDTVASLRTSLPSKVLTRVLDTQSDLAAMIGGTRQSVDRLLSGLVEDGLVVIERHTLRIPDVDALVQEADR
jgi:hypothetical protein